jgi:peptidoglycan/LPS O-acetylase OafA/YrhL
MVHEVFVVVLLIAMKRLSWGVPFRDAAGHARVAIDPWIGDALGVFLVVLTIGVAGIAYKYVEEPGRTFGRRLRVGGSITKVA